MVEHSIARLFLCASGRIQLPEYRQQPHYGDGSDVSLWAALSVLSGLDIAGAALCIIKNAIRTKMQTSSFPSLRNKKGRQRVNRSCPFLEIRKGGENRRRLLGGSVSLWRDAFYKSRCSPYRRPLFAMAVRVCMPCAIVTSIFAHHFAMCRASMCLPRTIVAR